MAAVQRMARPRDAQTTRARLLDVALREFAQRGYDGARVERIVREAGVTARMLYHYFGSKEGLYIAVLERAYADIRGGEQALALDEGDPREALGRLVDYTFDFLRDRPLFVKLTRSEAMLEGRHVRRSEAIGPMSRSLMGAIERLLARGRACGAFLEDADPLQLYVSIVALGIHHINAAHTMGAVFGVDMTDPDWVARRRAHVRAMILRSVGAAQTRDRDDRAAV